MIWNVIMFKKILYSRFTLDAMLTYRSSCSLVLLRIASLKNCTNVTSDMRGIIFLFRLQFYLKKSLNRMYFPVQLMKFYKTAFSKNTFGRFYRRFYRLIQQIQYKKWRHIFKCIFSCFLNSFDTNSISFFDKNF